MDSSISLDISTNPFSATTAFVLPPSKLYDLTTDQMEICNGYVHLPFLNRQHKVDLVIVLSIVLHQYAAYAAFTPRGFESTKTQGKFIVNTRPILPIIIKEKKEKKMEEDDVDLTLLF